MLSSTLISSTAFFDNEIQVELYHVQITKIITDFVYSNFSYSSLFYSSLSFSSIVRLHKCPTFTFKRYKKFLYSNIMSSNVIFFNLFYSYVMFSNFPYLNFSSDIRPKPTLRMKSGCSSFSTYAQTTDNH